MLTTKKKVTVPSFENVINVYCLPRKDLIRIINDYSILDNDKKSLLHTTKFFHNLKSDIVWQTPIRMKHVPVIKTGILRQVSIEDEADLRALQSVRFDDVLNPLVIQRIVLKKSFGKEISQLVPLNTHCVEISLPDVKNVGKSIPSFVKTISIKDCGANTLLHDIPSTVKNLYIESNNVHKLAGRIPVSIDHLYFGHSFKRSIEGCIPYYVKRLYIGDGIKQSIEYLVPPFVTHLYLGEGITGVIGSTIPITVTHLVLRCRLVCIEDILLPPSITHLTLGSSVRDMCRDFIPSSVTNLTLHFGFDDGLEFSIPPYVKKLTLLSYINIRRSDIIPSSVTHLVLGHATRYYPGTREITCMLPSSITHLEINSQFNTPIHKYIPSSVTHLTIGNNNKYIDKEKIPKSVKCLMLREAHDKLLKNIPSSVLYVGFDHYPLKSSLKLIPSTVSVVEIGIAKNDGSASQNPNEYSFE